MLTEGGRTIIPDSDNDEDEGYINDSLQNEAEEDGNNTDEGAED